MTPTERPLVPITRIKVPVGPLRRLVDALIDEELVAGATELLEVDAVALAALIGRAQAAGVLYKRIDLGPLLRPAAACIDALDTGDGRLLAPLGPNVTGVRAPGDPAQ